MLKGKVDEQAASTAPLATSDRERIFHNENLYVVSRYVGERSAISVDYWSDKRLPHGGADRPRRSTDLDNANFHA